MSRNYFKDKTIWITGASSGLGESFAKSLSKRGGHIILSSRRKSELQRVQSELLNPEKSRIVTVDMEQSASIDAASQSILDLEKVDIAILNAGISQRSSALDTDLEVEEKIMAVNYFGVVRAAKNILPTMLRSGFGHLVIISSVTGKIGVPHRSTYAASKHALHGYFDSLRAELEEKGIKITMICPGYVHTKISSNALDGSGKPQQKIDENSKNGMTTEAFMRKAIPAIENQKREALIGGKETLGVYLKRFIPSLLFTIVKNTKA
ncbi:SDR family oxidoreductase [Portibacter marinus]|uniref:SDR family oxidoreductase n=1 Tax=Portibacter marinus TaxID=2898660 RepID=UPI001F3C4349|nr:SDR family oxidoreductase [Portibacter marinus]